MWRRIIIGALYSLLVMATSLVALLFIFLLQSKVQIFDHTSPALIKDATPFPVSVDIYSRSIVENPKVEDFFVESLAEREMEKTSWWNKVLALFHKEEWYQNMASPVSRVVVIWPGQRKEEVATDFAKILNWSDEQKGTFLTLVDTAKPIIKDGKYLPDRYITHRDVSPEEMAKVINESFSANVLSHYTEEVEKSVPLKEALIIASLIEKEANTFENMREVSGVIWNRLFSEMPLQLDATLQYVKGSSPYESTWWPQVRPNDKFTSSAYNTYKNSGLPPSPIANPSVEAIVAALNPIVTDCYFYFHTNDGSYHCSNSYQEHVSKLRSIYGKGS